jgi:hypothetical protein
MSQSAKFWLTSSCLAVLTAILVFFFDNAVKREKEWRHVEQSLMKQKADLERENQRLKKEIVWLNNQNLNLKRYVAAFEKNFIELQNSTANFRQIGAPPSADLPESLASESAQVRQAFRDMLSERRLWDQYQKEQYKGVLESTLEPRVIGSRNLELANESARAFFVELESALNLHKRLIRDVRLFHDEIEFQKSRHLANEAYELYDLKFQLAPFAFEAALADALQQAMSALSAGIYQQEAVEVLDRIGEAFTMPIQELYAEWMYAQDDPALSAYNYNLYALFGKKLLDYSDTLTQQSLVALGPSAYGELDFFNRQLFDRLYDLYLLGQVETADPSCLDLDALEQVLYSRQ